MEHALTFVYGAAWFLMFIIFCVAIYEITRYRHEASRHDHTEESD